MSAEEKIQSLIAARRINRIEAISRAGLGERSEAAKRVIQKRDLRLQYINAGMPHEQACLVVNNKEC